MWMMKNGRNMSVVSIVLLLVEEKEIDQERQKERRGRVKSEVSRCTSMVQSNQSVRRRRTIVQSEVGAAAAVIATWSMLFSVLL